MIKIEHNIIGMCATNTYYVYDDETKRGLIIDPAETLSEFLNVLPDYR